MRRPAWAVAVLTFAALFAACAHGPEELLGNWTGEDAEGNRHTLSFNERGRALWSLEGEGVDEDFELRYRYDDEATPHHLDLSGFDHGPLQEKSLYCILEWQAADAFRMDCETGESKKGGESVRPKDFGRHSLLYMKVTR
ncbi:MAG TPA: hypothetical protein VF121_05745 [Thermoanaerobaculia bacterium]|nr:hypothetical protein [Thermoanaerobaculia bacterium]